MYKTIQCNLILSVALETWERWNYIIATNWLIIMSPWFGKTDKSARIWNQGHRKISDVSCIKLFQILTFVAQIDGWAPTELLNIHTPSSYYRDREQWMNCWWGPTHINCSVLALTQVVQENMAHRFQMSTKMVDIT